MPAVRVITSTQCAEKTVLGRVNPFCPKSYINQLNSLGSRYLDHRLPVQTYSIRAISPNKARPLLTSRFMVISRRICIRLDLDTFGTCPSSAIRPTLVFTDGACLYIAVCRACSLDGTRRTLLSHDLV
jgi:hypothetical protein